MEYNRDKAIETIGGNQFELVLVAAQRARALKQGATAKVESNNREGITALIEIQEGLYTKEDYLTKLAGKKTKDEIKEEMLALKQETEDAQSF